MSNPLPSFRSWSDYSILGPYGIAITTLTTVSQQVLGADNARALLTYAFAAEVLETIEVDALREGLEALAFARFTQSFGEQH